MTQLMGLAQQRIDALEAENDELRERVRQLEEEASVVSAWRAPLEFGLTPAEEKILAALMSRDMATKVYLHQALADASGFCAAEIKIVDVYICKLRKKLNPFGVPVQTHWGRGYSISNQARDMLVHWDSRGTQ